jgi:hypothetical protein
MGTIRNGSQKSFKKNARKLQLNSAGLKCLVPLSTIRAQLKMLESTLRRIFVFTKANPIVPGSLRQISVVFDQKAHGK